MFMNLHDVAPPYFSNDATQSPITVMRRVHVCCAVDENSFFVAGPQVWNGLN